MAETDRTCGDQQRTVVRLAGGAMCPFTFDVPFETFSKMLIERETKMRIERDIQPPMETVNPAWALGCEAWDLGIANPTQLREIVLAAKDWDAAFSRVQAEDDVANSIGLMNDAKARLRAALTVKP